MSESHHHHGPNVGLLLIIPAAAVVAKAAMRRHQAMWGEIGAGDGAGAHAPGHRHGPWGAAGPGAEGFRLPPRIESMLDTWHAKAHASDTASAPDASAPDAPEATA